VAAVKEIETEHGPKRVGFSASIADATLYDLIQMQCLSGSHAVVRVTSGDEAGYLYFRGGAIVHAMTSSNLGEEAALEILSWTTGSFEPCNAGWPESESMHVSPQALLLRAAQVSDESGRQNLVPFRRAKAESHVARTESSPDAPVSSQRPGGSAPDSRRVLSGAPATRIQAAVRLDPNGAVMSSRGAGGEDLAAAAALAMRLSNMIGDPLALDRLKAIEASGSTQVTLVVVEANGNLVALRAPIDADLTTVRERYGI
jgi:predicted regulator of Ras-like GTPase activity (Roadblock/LC7/MglB family)